ncbi:MAG TPA: L,D-transpeptidase family protein [Chitinophagaceae bacterium]|nr:L,D-transpeptidase family protein [Chitinophagaceae bacterium]
MKQLLTWAAICSLFIACNGTASNGDANGGNGKGAKSELEKKVTKRDHSITASNAYSDLFMDSSDLEKFIQQKKPSDSIIRRMRSFYNARNYQFAWFSADGLTEQARGFWNLHEYYTAYSDDTSLNDKKLERRMDAYILEDVLSPAASDAAILNTELTLTQHFIEYSLKNYEKGYIKRKELERFIPRKRLDAMYLADSLLNKKHKDDKYYEDVNEAYKKLKDQLGKYYAIQAKGGWQPIVTEEKKFKPGASSPAIQLIKKRLHVTGELPGTDTTAVYSDTLATAIQAFQQRHGLKPDGIITEAVIKELNVSALQRIQQILMNMDRMRWMPSRPDGNMIMVNIPEFVLHVWEGNTKAFDMDVVVGKEGHNTMMFTGNLNQVVFSPHWNVPPSIVQKEILPAIEKNPNYLAKENMEITGHDEDGLPEIRQKPGGKNALGKVKFLFPNSFNIYFHDTPAKDLFNRSKRAFSHGCIRLSDPVKMANYLLRNDPNWPPEKIEEAMNSGKEKFVKLKDPIPVFITYYTAWVDEYGQMNFREDIYGHDEKLAAKMFPGVVRQPLARK